MENHKISAFIDEDARAIKALYYEYRDAFIQFGKRYQLEEEVLVDIYQDAFVALRKNALNGKLAEVKSGMKTYLFGIGKNLIFNELKRVNKFVPLKESVEDKVEVLYLEETSVLTEEQRILRRYFQKLGEKCKQVLTMFYYRGLSIEEIATQAGYDSQNVVRSQKSRCLKTLREAINSPKK